MAIEPQTAYPTQIETGDPGYPLGKAKNVTVQGDGTGTPLERDWVNDIWGFLQAMLDSAGITATGTPDEVGASQYLDALDALANLNTPTAVVRFETGSSDIILWQRGKVTANTVITYSAGDAIITFTAPICASITNVVIQATVETFGAVSFLSAEMVTTSTLRVRRWNGDTGAAIDMSAGDSINHVTVWSDVP